MIQIEVFVKQMKIMSARFHTTFAGDISDRYYESFNEKLSTEQFEAMCNYLFDSADEFFPIPRQFIDHARQLLPDTALPPAPVEADRPVPLSEGFAPEFSVPVTEPIEIPKGLEGAAIIKHVIAQIAEQKTINW